MKLAELDQSFTALGKHQVCLHGDIIWFVIRGHLELPEMVSLVAPQPAVTKTKAIGSGGTRTTLPCTAPTSSSAG